MGEVGWREGLTEPTTKNSASMYSIVTPASLRTNASHQRPGPKQPVDQLGHVLKIQVLGFRSAPK
jgi:hypothetical protein